MNHHGVASGEFQEGEPTSLRFIEHHIQILAQRETIGEQDFEELHRNIERFQLQESELRIVMLALAKTLRDRDEEELLSLSISLERIARLEFPKPDAPLEESLHDLPERQLDARAAVMEAFSNSLCLNDPWDSEPAETVTEEIHEPNDLSAEYQLARSWLFAEEDRAEDQPPKESDESSESIYLPKGIDPRLVALEKMRSGEKLIADDRVHWKNSVSTIDVRKTRVSQIGTKAQEIKKEEIETENDLHLKVLTIIEELKELINGFLRVIYRELEMVWLPGQEDRVFERFFSKNQEQLSAIFAMDAKLAQLEEDCREVTEMGLEREFLLETIADFMDELEKVSDPGGSDYAGLLSTGMHTQLRKLLEHSEEIHERLERIQDDFSTLFQEFWKLKIIIPNPWK